MRVQGIFIAAAIALGLAGCAAPAHAPGSSASVITITAGGVSRNVLFLAPSTKPKAAVVIFSGGEGVIGIGQDGSIEAGGNFLVRTRSIWVADGLLYVAVDAVPSEDSVGPENRQAIAAVLQAVRQRTDAPIWLVGTSAGTAAAMAGAASAPANLLSGVVISSPVTMSGKRRSVFDVPLDHITVPVLIQTHRDDTCPLTPPDAAPAIKAALTHAPITNIQTFSGGAPARSQPCQPFSAHGFVGLEPHVVHAATAWITTH